jgi:hypothetical protein
MNYLCSEEAGIPMVPYGAHPAAARAVRISCDIRATSERKSAIKASEM